jgi:hypothetical protein
MQDEGGMRARLHDTLPCMCMNSFAHNLGLSYRGERLLHDSGAKRREPQCIIAYVAKSIFMCLEGMVLCTSRIPNTVDMVSKARV